MEVSFEPAVEGEKFVQRNAGKEERNAKAGRVHRQQKHAFGHSLLRAGNCQNAGKDRTDTRRPTKRKGQAKHQRACESARFVYVVKPFVFVEEVNFEDTGQVNSKNDEDKTGQLTEKSHARHEDLPDPSGRSAEQNECDREPDDEHDRVEQHRSE